MFECCITQMSLYYNLYALHPVWYKWYSLSVRIDLELSLNINFTYKYYVYIQHISAYQSSNNVILIIELLLMSNQKYP